MGYPAYPYYSPPPPSHTPPPPPAGCNPVMPPPPPPPPTKHHHHPKLPPHYPPTSPPGPSPVPPPLHAPPPKPSYPPNPSTVPTPPPKSPPRGLPPPTPSPHPPKAPPPTPYKASPPITPTHPPKAHPPTPYMAPPPTPVPPPKAHLPTPHKAPPPYISGPPVIYGAPAPLNAVAPSSEIVSPLPGGNHTTIIAVCVSLGGAFFLAFLLVGLISSANKKKMPVMVPGAPVRFEKQEETHETFPTGPRGEQTESVVAENDGLIHEVGGTYRPPSEPAGSSGHPRPHRTALNKPKRAELQEARTELAIDINEFETIRTGPRGEQTEPVVVEDDGLIQEAGGASRPPFESDGSSGHPRPHPRAANKPNRAELRDARTQLAKDINEPEATTIGPFGEQTESVAVEDDGPIQEAGGASRPPGEPDGSSGHPRPNPSAANEPNRAELSVALTQPAGDINQLENSGSGSSSLRKWKYLNRFVNKFVKRLASRLVNRLSNKRVKRLANRLVNRFGNMLTNRLVNEAREYA